MKRIFFTILLCFLVSGAYRISAQESYKPEVFGIIKAKYEVSEFDGQQWFSVRNSRLGIRGWANANIHYTVMIEAASQASLGLVYANIGYKVGGLEIILGQQSNHLGLEYTRGTGGNYFANRSLLNKFLTRYYTDDGKDPVVGDIGTSDLGAMVRYRQDGVIPVEVMLGLFNGSGSTNPQFRRGANLLGRLIVGDDTGLAGSAGYYGGNSILGTRMDVWTAGLRYNEGPFRIEAEYGERKQKTDEEDTMRTGVVFAQYRFPVVSSLARSISPVLRYDFGDNVKFINKSGKLDAFTAQRITGGITIGLSEKELKSEIRINYEHYFLKNKPSDYKENQLLQNKFVIEFFVSF